MKKKLALAAVIILLFAVAGYGTYAYLTASTTAKNVITAGTVDIKLTDVPKNIEVHKSLGAGGASEYVMPDTDKAGSVFVKNIGSKDCYVRVKLIPTISLGKTLLPTGVITLLTDVEHWVYDKDTGYWYYKSILGPKNYTSNLLNSIKFSKDMGNEYQNSEIHINVSAQAVQVANNDYDEYTGSVLDVQGWPATPTPATSATP